MIDFLQKALFFLNLFQKQLTNIFNNEQTIFFAVFHNILDQIIS
jgi:hypothetical protein